MAMEPLPTSHPTAPAAPLGHALRTCPWLAMELPNPSHEWPSSRYFQVHFEHLQSSLAMLRQEIETQRRLLLDLHRQVELAQRGRDIPEPAPFRFSTQ